MRTFYGTVMTTTFILPSIVTLMLLVPDAIPFTVTTTLPLPSVVADAGVSNFQNGTAQPVGP